MEGFWGMLISIVVITIFSFIPCSENMDCPINANSILNIFYY